MKAVAALIAAGAALGVLQTFIIGKHFVIPTMVLLIAIIFGNLARSGLRGGKMGEAHSLLAFPPGFRAYVLRPVLGRACSGQARFLALRSIRCTAASA